MATSSEGDFADFERVETQIRHFQQEPATVLETNRNLDANDITGVGGHFSEDVLYSPDLHLSDEEDAGNSAQIPGTTAQTPGPAHQPRPHYTGSISSPVTSRRHTVIARLNSEPYLRPEEIELLRSRRERRESRHTRSSDTEYHSARGYPACSDTDATDNDDHADEEHPPRIPTPYFTPSHTPPHNSEGTAEDVEEDEEGWEGREPMSPNPFSIYYPYNASYGESAVARFPS